MRLARQLTAEGFQVTLVDDTFLLGQPSLGAALESHFRDSEVVVPVLDRKANRSQWIPRELEAAVKFNREEAVPVEVKLAVACDTVSQSPDGKIDIHGVFTEVAGLSLPYVVPQVHLAIFCDANVAEVGTRTFMEARFQEEDGDVVLSAPHVHVVPPSPRPGTRSSFNIVFPFVNILFDKPGHYEFVVLVGGETKATAPIYANEPIQAARAERSTTTKRRVDEGAGYVGTPIVLTPVPAMGIPISEVRSEEFTGGDSEGALEKASRPTGRGKLAHTRASSDEFARRKQEEIKQEERPR